LAVAEIAKAPQQDAAQYHSFETGGNMVGRTPFLKVEALSNQAEEGVRQIQQLGGRGHPVIRPERGQQGLDERSC